MMQLCEFCSNWAQWQLRWIEPQEKEKDEKLVPRGLKLTEGPYLCGAHMNELKAQPSDIDRRFSFIGAHPAAN